MTSRSAGSAGPIRCCRRWDFSARGCSDDVKGAFGATDTAPLIVADAFVTLESSGRRASNVIVYGVDERFWSSTGLPPIDGVMVSPALAAEVGAKDGDVLLTRLQKPSEIPIESLFGRKEDVGRTVRLTLAGVLPRDRLGEFALRPQQADVRAVFAPLRRLQRDLAVPGQVNTVLVSGGERSDAKAQIGAAARGSWRPCDAGVLKAHAVAIESANGIVSEALETAARGVVDKLGLQPDSRFHLSRQLDPQGRSADPVFARDSDGSGTGARGRRRGRRRDWTPSVAPTARRSERGRDRAEWVGRARARGSAGRSRSTSTTTSGTRSRSRHAHRVVHACPRVVPIVGHRGRPTVLRLTIRASRRSKSLADWDPPFPIDLSRVRPEDERYWDESGRRRKPSFPTSAAAICGGRDTAR